MNLWHDQERNLLIYPGQSPVIAQAIPETRQLNGSYFAVPRTLHNCQVLRWYNYPVVPIMDDYDWPAQPSIKPYESQKVSANFMVLQRRCCVLSDMGVGKTLAALWAADWLMRRHPPGQFRALIVAPLSILQRVWADAIFKNFLQRRTFEILHGNADKRSTGLDKNADFFIINFDGVGVGAHTRKKFELDGFSAELAARDDIKLAIIDEASAYKDAQTKRHRIARLVFGKKDYLWLMTGTPTPNRPSDAYGLGKLVSNAFGKSFTTFRQEVEMQLGPYKWVPRADGYEKARKLLTPSIRYDIADVWDGPELTTTQREVLLTAEQKKLMAELKKNLQVIVSSGQPITAPNEAAARLKFMQISLGAIYDSGHKAHAIDASPRLDELKSVIEQAPGKVLVFVPLTSVIHILYKALHRWSREIVNGEVSQKDRSRIFQDFQQSGQPRLLLLDPGTASHGLDLWQAQTVIWYGCTEKSELYAQANRRAHRPGQRYPVSIVQIVSNPLEREIFRRLENNLSLQNVLLDMVRSGAI